LDQFLTLLCYTPKNVKPIGFSPGRAALVELAFSLLIVDADRHLPKIRIPIAALSRMNEVLASAAFCAITAGQLAANGTPANYAVPGLTLFTTY
jgi:hypothetical protein